MKKNIKYVDNIINYNVINYIIYNKNFLIKIK